MASDRYGRARVVAVDDPGQPHLDAVGGVEEGPGGVQLEREVVGGAHGGDRGRGPDPIDGAVRFLGIGRRRRARHAVHLAHEHASVVHVESSDACPPARHTGVGDVQEDLEPVNVHRAASGGSDVHDEDFRIRCRCRGTAGARSVAGDEQAGLHPDAIPFVVVHGSRAWGCHRGSDE